MSAQAPLAVHRFAVGSRECVMTISRPGVGAMAACVVEWLPDVPQRLTAGELQEYRAGRDRVLASVSKQLGITAAVVEL